MFYERDLYPGLAGMSTRDKTIVDQGTREDLHAISGISSPMSIWVAVAIFIGAIIVLGIFGSK